MSKGAVAARRIIGGPRGQTHLDTAGHACGSPERADVVPVRQVLRRPFVLRASSNAQLVPCSARASLSASTRMRACVRAYDTCVCVRACVRAYDTCLRMCACVRACVRTWAHAHAWVRRSGRDALRCAPGQVRVRPLAAPRSQVRVDQPREALVQRRPVEPQPLERVIAHLRAKPVCHCQRIP